MDTKNQCPKCLKIFSSPQRLRSHSESKKNCQIKLGKFVCQFCQKSFSRKFYLNKHLEKHKDSTSDPIDNQTVKPLFPIKLILKTNHDTNDPTNQLNFLKKQADEQTHIIAQLVEKQNQKITELIESKIAEQNQKIAELMQKPHNVINNNLNIICVGQNDNYLDMLTQQLGFDRAIEYIKDCALSSLTGDCKLIEKIYIENHPESITYIDKKRAKIQYFDENGNKIIDNKAQFGRKVANNLQNSYLKGINHLITENLNNKRCPNKFLEDYDIQAWNQHIFDLSELGYQKKIVNNLNIPQL